MLIPSLRVPALVLLGCLASPATSATFEIDFSLLGSGSYTGTFEADPMGGVVSNFVATIGAVTFDTQVSGAAFEYDPLGGDFVNYTGFPAFTNSVAVAGVCGVGLCALELYPNPYDPVPGDYLAIDEFFNNIDDGTKYAINPVPTDGVIPLPASLPLMIGAGVMLAAVRRRRSATRDR
ncbi:hypothetical protein [Pseudooceanicola sp. LIPI14-2-Ac024]|uniref:hypothetical protein n=1 Tax=Pseudooceanicola sp. LIPI14-2-Ac024 TaxID=3344875 RepID=UPI0035CE9D24